MIRTYKKHKTNFKFFLSYRFQFSKSLEYSLKFKRTQVVVEGLRAHVRPLVAATLALVSDPEVFDSLVNEASPACRHLDLVGVFELLTLDLLRLKQATTRWAFPEHLISSH